MKIFFAIALGFLLLAIAKSLYQPKLGVEKGSLLPCGSAPNCAKLNYQLEGRLWKVAVKQEASKLGFDLLEEKERYLRFLAKTPLLRFHDDVEFYQEEGSDTLQMRSSSRLGYYDMGTNEKRLKLFVEKLSRRKPSPGSSPHSAL